MALAAVLIKAMQDDPDKAHFLILERREFVGDSIDRFSAASHFSPKQFSPWPRPAWWLRRNLSTGDSDRPLFRAESMISLQRILSGRARAWDNGNIFSIPRRIVASDPLQQLSSSERVFFPPLFLMWSSPPSRLPARHSIYQSIMNSVISRVSASQSA